MTSDHVNHLGEKSARSSQKAKWGQKDGLRIESKGTNRHLGLQAGDSIEAKKQSYLPRKMAELKKERTEL